MKRRKFKTGEATRGTKLAFSNRRGKTTKPKGTVIPLREEEVMLPLLRSGWPQRQFRHGEHVHVSDLLTKCIRKIAVSERTGEAIHGETIWPGRGLTFEFGHATQNYVTEHLKAVSPKELYGNWWCPCESTKIQHKTWAQVKDKKCKTCGHAPFRYMEIVLEDKKRQVTGAIDIMLRLDGLFYPVECKSMAKNQWVDLKRPKPDHLLQATFYWDLLHQHKWPLWDQASVLYVNKEFMWSGSPFKEFVFTPTQHIHRLEDMQSEAQSLVRFREDGILPPRVMCQTKDSPEAKRCQFRHICFDMED